MEISLPPGTQHYIKTGTARLSLTPRFLNSPITTISYRLKLWGIQNSIPFHNSTPKPTQQQQLFAQFRVTTSLGKLTGYFVDMGVIIIEALDARLNIPIGYAYLKIKRYIINGLLSQFQETVQILAQDKVRSKKTIIGQAIIKLQLNVPINAVPQLIQPSPHVPHYIPNTNQPHRIPQHPQQPQRPHHGQGTQRITDSTHYRKIIQQPYIFDPYQHPPQCIPNQRQTDSRQYRNDPQNDIILQALKTKPKITASNVLNYLVDDSLQEYPDIDRLVQKYGRNDVNAQKMRLKLDQAKYLNKTTPTHSIPSSKQPHKGGLIRLHNIKFLLNTSTSQTHNFTIKHMVSDRDPTILNQALVKDIKDSALFYKQISSGNVIDVESKVYKGRFVVRKEHIEGGDIGKMYLKRNDNNKKVAEIDIKIQQLYQHNAYSPQKKDPIPSQPQTHPNTNTNTTRKQHYYIHIQAIRKGKRQANLILHPRCQKQGVAGKKIIFTGNSTSQIVNISLVPGDGQKDSRQISINPQIRMKEDNIQIGGNMYRLFVAVADGIDQLMKMVVMHDKHIQPNTQPTNPILPIPPALTNPTRPQKLHLLFLLFHSLSCTQNSTCMSLITKLQSSHLTHQQQVPLFQQLCIQSNTPHPHIITQHVYQQLLHQQFGMFWNCFMEWKYWDQMWWACVSKARSMLWREMGGIGARRGRGRERKGLEGLLRRMHSSKDVLFGLIKYQVCQSIVKKYVEQHIAQHVQQQAITFSQAQQPILTQSRNPSPISTLILDTLLNLLTLLCRYNSTTGHCIKLQQLTDILMSDNIAQCRVYFNQHQMQAIVYSHEEQRDDEQEVGILVQVVKSCIDGNGVDGKGGCIGIRSVINRFKNAQTQSSSLSQPNRINTDNNTVNIHTQQQQPNIHTQPNLPTQPNPSYIPANPSYIPAQPSSPPSVPQTLYISSFTLTQQNILTISSTQQRIQIYKSSTNIPMYQFSVSELPRSVVLRSMQDYKIRVEIMGQGQDVYVLEGVFLCCGNVDRILLYDGNMKNVGYINVGFKSQSLQQQQIQLQIHHRQPLPQPINQPIPYPQPHQLHQPKPQKLIPLHSHSIRYKIVSVYPPSHEYTLSIQYAQHLITYPDHHLTGKIVDGQHNSTDGQHNSMDGQQHNSVDGGECGCLKMIAYVGDGAQFVGKLWKSKGMQEVCFSDQYGKIGCIVNIQLNQDNGQQIIQKQQDNLQRVLLLNMYHIQCLKPTLPPSLTLVLNTSSTPQPCLIKSVQSQAEHPRHNWLGVHTRLQASTKYQITIYEHKNKTMHKYMEEQVVAHFQFSVVFHVGKIGIYENRGYLVDGRTGCRLAITVFQVNYNDVFSRDPIGRNKFQSILQIFTIQNILTLHKHISPSSPSSSTSSYCPSLPSLLSSTLGYTTTQTHLLHQLQLHPNQLYNIIKNWDVDHVSLNYQQLTNISIGSYSVRDLYTEYQIYDFYCSGYIPMSKMDITNMLIFGKYGKYGENASHGGKSGIDGGKFKVNGKQGWVVDLQNMEDKGQVDYMLVLWCLRKVCMADNFFTQSQNNTYPTPTPSVDPSSISPKLKIRLLSYKNIAVDGQPSTLTFYINGQKLSQPIPRCYTHQYHHPKTIQTHWPILLEVYNKKYGIKELYSEQLVASLKIQSQRVKMLGGELLFDIDEQVGREIIGKNGKQERQKEDTNTTNINFRQSRRQKWQNMKQSREETQKIVNILSNLTS